MPTTKFYLFKVTVEPRNDSDYSTLSEMLDNPPEEPVILAKAGQPFQLDGKVKKSGSIYSGTFCLIQKDDLPTKAKFGEEPKDLIDDDDDSGLGHYTSFIYDSDNGAIAIQSNRNGVSPNGVAQYFRRNYKVKDVKFEFIINPDDLEKLNSLSTISSIEISIAKPESAHPFTTGNRRRAFSDITDLADRTNANTMTIHLGLGYEKNATLKKSGFLPIIRSLFQKDMPHEVRKVEIAGRESDEEGMEVIDLVNNKVIIPVHYPKAKTVTPQIISAIIKDAIKLYSDLKPKIDKTYKVKRKD